MPLDAIDHYILRHNMGAAVNARELQQQLAEQAAANQGHLAIVKTLVAAYNANNWQTIQAILGDYNTRNQIYQAAYYPTYSTFRPT